MTLSGLALRGFRFYLRTYAATIAGAAIATAVITGALLVGSSVKASLRDLAIGRLGNAEWVVTRPQFFREQLSGELNGAPLIEIQGVVVRQSEGRRVQHVSVYAVDERFWTFQRYAGTPPSGREIVLSPALGAELNAKTGDGILLQVETPSAMPRESMQGRKEDAAKTVRLKIAEGVAPDFALRPQQGATRCAFVNLATLQRELGESAKVNTILLDRAHKPDPAVVRLEDMGVKLRPANDYLSVETDSAVIPKGMEEAVGKLAPRTAPILTYLINKLVVSNRTVPYSLVAAVSRQQMEIPPGGIVLNDWVARDLRANVGDPVTAEYFFWDPTGSLETRTAKFRVSRIIATADDRTMAPEYPGITDSESMQGWDPPFPINLKLVRPVDEEYWKRYRTTPKGFISLEDGRALWASRFGSSTMIRAYGVSTGDFAKKLRDGLQPNDFGIVISDVREANGKASEGSTDFGEYFLYFSFFLVGSALLLLVLFFQFGVEQRLREIGMLRSVGYSSGSIGRLFLGEGVAIALVGSLAGVLLAVLYANLILIALTTIWRAAVGTSYLSLHISPEILITGWLSGFVCSVITLWLALRRIRKQTPRQLLSGHPSTESFKAPGRFSRAVIGAALVGGLSMAALGIAGKTSRSEAFFGAAVLLLVAAIGAVSAGLKGRLIVGLNGPATLGLRNAAWRPGRSALSVGLIASATFLLVALESFRYPDLSQGLGGFSLVAESQQPIVYDLNGKQGQDALGLSGRSELAGLKYFAFRLKGGDDPSCLNLYEPRDPRVIGAGINFLSGNRFGFNWKALSAVESNGAVPAVGDRNSVQYVLHKEIGDEIVLSNGAKLKIVGLLDQSVLQSELVISEENFKRLFPLEQGYRFFLIEGPEGAVGALNDALSDYGFDATKTVDRLTSFTQVESTYLSTFQMLGGLGLLLGTVGLGAVLLRNLLERVKEVGLLRAVGFRLADLSRMVLAENATLALLGVVVGAGTAMVAIAPGFVTGQMRLPGLSVIVLVMLVPVVALAASLVAIRVLKGRNLLESLRSGL